MGKCLYRWTRRHPVGSRVQVHYEPRGADIRFAGESILDIYAWKKIFVTFVIVFAGLGLLRLARWQQENQPDTSPTANRDTQDAPAADELIDLNLR